MSRGRRGRVEGGGAIQRLEGGEGVAGRGWKRRQVLRTHHQTDKSLGLMLARRERDEQHKDTHKEGTQDKHKEGKEAKQTGRMGEKAGRIVLCLRGGGLADCSTTQGAGVR